MHRAQAAASWVGVLCTGGVVAVASPTLHTKLLSAYSDGKVRGRGHARVHSHVRPSHAHTNTPLHTLTQSRCIHTHAPARVHTLPPRMQVGTATRAETARLISAGLARRFKPDAFDLTFIYPSTPIQKVVAACIHTAPRACVHTPPRMHLAFI